SRGFVDHARGVASTNPKTPPGQAEAGRGGFEVEGLPARTAFGSSESFHLTSTYPNHTTGIGLWSMGMLASSRTRSRARGFGRELVTAQLAVLLRGRLDNHLRQLLPLGCLFTLELQKHLSGIRLAPKPRGALLVRGSQADDKLIAALPVDALIDCR